MSKKTEEKKKVETTGHSWDGIEEYNNPLPRWWVWVFYATIVWGIWYSIAYPAWPLLKGATAGYLGFSTRGQVAEEIQKFKDMNAGLDAELAKADLTTLDRGSELYNYAIQSGKATFNTWCVQCHQREGGGAPHFPVLSDNDWLWGGSLEDIQTTIRYGIRSMDFEDDTRFSEMPAFADDNLSDEEIDQVVNYVMSLSPVTKADADATLAEAGATVFADNCAACHGDDATGDRSVGAPNLADAIWLHGSTKAEIKHNVSVGPKGVMPAWSTKLTEAQINAVATYVHQLGGGE